MAELNRPLNLVRETDEAGVSPVSTRRSTHSPSSPSSNPFSSASLFGRGGSGYSRMPSDGIHEMSDLGEVPRQSDRDVDGLGISMNSTDPTASRNPAGSPSEAPLGLNASYYNSPAPLPSGPARNSKSQFASTVSGLLQSSSYLGAEGVRGNQSPGLTPDTHYAAGAHTPGHRDPGPDYIDDEYDDDVFYKKFGKNKSSSFRSSARCIFFFFFTFFLTPFLSS